MYEHWTQKFDQPDKSMFLFMTDPKSCGHELEGDIGEGLPYFLASSWHSMARRPSSNCFTAGDRGG